MIVQNSAMIIAITSDEMGVDGGELYVAVASTSMVNPIVNPPMNWIIESGTDLEMIMNHLLNAYKDQSGELPKGIIFMRSYQ